MPLKTIRDADALLRKRYAARLAERLALRAFPALFAQSPEPHPSEGALFALSLGRVSQKDAEADLLGLREAAQAWRALAQKRLGWSIEEKTLTLRTLRAVLSIPATLFIEDDEALIAALAPADLSVADWREALSRLTRLASQFAGCSAPMTPERALNLSRAAKSSGALFRKTLSDPDFERLLGLISWLRAHPDAGCFVREIPLEGIDSKWFERHRRMLAAIWNALFDADRTPAGFAQAAGLRTPPKFVRVRHAAPWFGCGIEDGYDAQRDALMVPIEVLARRAPEAGVVLIIENEQTGLSVNAPEDVPILIGMGYGIAALDAVEWLQKKRILYFGDLDTHGLAILAECRRLFPQTESFLMDPATFEQFRALAVTESRQAGAAPSALTPAEAALYEKLLATHGRLEQERIPLAVVNDAIARLLKEPAR